MGVRIPDLDDRTYEEILADAIEQLPVRAEAWTDHNVHDPGRTLLELLAWVAETYGFQVDQITDDHVRKYLKLLGERRRPPQPATVPLALRAPESMQGTVIEDEEPVVISDDSGFSGVFETTKPVTLSLTNVDRVVSTHADGRTDNSIANDTFGMHFLAFGERAERGSTMALGLDRDPFENADIVDLTVSYHDDGLPDAVSPIGAELGFEPSVDLVWEYCVDYDGNEWRPFEIRRDQTTQLYTGGTVALENPTTDADWGLTPGVAFDGNEDRYWIRCRVRTPGFEVPPAIESLGFDIVDAVHRTTATDAVLERPTGATETGTAPGQTFVFENDPVLSADVVVGDTPWTEVRDFDTSDPAAEHYVLDRSAGEIRFGTGVNGKIPRPGQTVTATSYTYGGGSAGNVPRSATCRFQAAAFEEIYATPVTSGDGGADAETLDAAIARVRAAQERSERAVTPGDHAAVAKQTPGLRFGRAKAFVETDVEPFGRADSTGITVVVVPYSPRPKPVPSAGFLEAVGQHLERNRLLGERVRVAPPEYVGIGVDVDVRIGSTYARAERRRAVVTALDEFLNPLSGYDGTGWPFGQAVHVSELYQTIEAVEGVEFAEHLSVRSTGGTRPSEDSTVRVPETGLVYPDQHDVSVATEGSD